MPVAKFKKIKEWNMNKEKFEKKVQELYAYEDEMLAKMNEIIKPYNEELNKQGYEIVIYPI